MIASFLFYCLYMFFAFYVVNHSPLTEEIRENLFPRLPYWMSYSVQCAFCFSFWITVVFNIMGFLPPFAFSAPVVVLFMNLIFERLKNDK